MTFFNVLHNGAKNDEIITFLRLETGGENGFLYSLVLKIILLKSLAKFK